jgi:hypothetical protein
MVGEGHAPVVVVLLASLKEKTDEPISAPKGAPFPHSLMFGLTMRFAAIRRVRRVRFSPHRNLSGEGHAPVEAVLGVVC